MKLYKTDEIDREYVLARDVVSSNYQVLLSSGTILKKDYLEKLIELGIKEVYVRDIVEVSTEKMLLLKEEIGENFRNSVKSVMERHIYHNSNELKELTDTADKIISNILDEDEVVQKVYDIKERNADIYEHSISLCSLATLTALKYGLDDEAVHDIGVACLLHDLGLRYLTIPYENKNLQELNEIEFIEYKKHPVYAYSSLKNETWISERSKNIILMHHEHIDGSGYPLKATNVPIEVNIVSVCDVFDEMICGIGCLRTKVYEAIEYLKIFKGIYYNSDVVDLFLRFTAVYPVGTHVELSDGRTGIVARQNAGFPERPVIRLIEDKDGNAIKEQILLDLLAEHSVFIKEVIY